MNREETLNAIAVMQAFADGKRIEICTVGKNDWSMMQEHSLPLWNWEDFGHRVAVMKPSIDWSHVAPEYRFLAVDDDECGHLYQNKPFVRVGEWEDSKNRKIYAPQASSFASYKRGDCHWSESLVERPEGV